MITLRIFRIELSPALLLGFCLAALAGPVFGQSAAKHWCVGRSGGVNFTTNPPTASLTTAAAFQPAEGGSSISDASGTLLLYTDGTQVFNGQHEVVSGSTNLGGHVSSSQSSLIVRQPGSQRYYFVFTTDAIESFPSAHQGLRYTLIDVQGPAGRPAVVTGQKSVLLANNTTEKLTACAASNGQDVWVVGHEFGSARFLAWKLTSTGLISSTPVYSTAGIAHGSTASGNYNPGRGCMKASPEGSLLASVILPPVNDRYVAELFRFNNATGQASLLADLSEPANGANDYNFYGVEFSSSASKLYISTRKGPYNIQQYDLCAPVPVGTLVSTAIKGSKTIAGTSTNQFGTLQLGPDDRIYCAKNSDPYLGVIQTPEIAGNGSTYRDQGLNLTGRTSTYGLNNLSASVFYKMHLSAAGSLGCQGQLINAAAQPRPLCGVALLPQVTASWNFGDPAGGPTNTSFGLIGRHAYSQGGVFRAVFTGTWGEAVDTISTLMRVESKPGAAKAILDSNYCQNTRVILVRVVAMPSATPVVWAQVGGAASRAVVAPGQVTVTTTANGNAWLRYVLHSPLGCPGDTGRVAWQINQQPAPTLAGPADVCLGGTGTYTPSVAGSYRYVFDGHSDSAFKGSFALPATATEGSHTVHIAGGSSGANRTCYVDGPDLTFNVGKNTPLTIGRWDSAYCPDVPGTRYQVKVPEELRDYVLWKVEGSYDLQGSTPDLRVLTWKDDAPKRVTVHAITVQGCPAQSFTTEVKTRCMEVMNLITANADGDNDHFYIKNLESYPGAEISIFSRQGKEVVNTVAQSNADLAGTAGLPHGTYFYLVKYRAGGDYQLKKGWVEVVR